MIQFHIKCKNIKLQTYQGEHNLKTGDDIKIENKLSASRKPTKLSQNIIAIIS